MNVKIRLFASARDLGGFSVRTLALPANATMEHVWKYLFDIDSGFHAWRGSLRFAVNEEYVTGTVNLKDGDEVSVIPPVSGG